METELDRALNLGTTRHNIVILITCSVIQVAAVLDMLAFSVVVPASSCDLKLSLMEISVLTSIPFAGYLFAMPWGYYADTRGRRRAILISASCGFLLASLSSLSSSFAMMLVLKFLGCCFSSASLTLTITYVGECTGSKRRNRYLYMMNSFNLGSDVICYGLAYYILHMGFNHPIPWLSINYRPWRLFTLVMAMPLGIGAFMMIFLHESPKFLVNIGEVTKAFKILTDSYKVEGYNEAYLLKTLITNGDENKAKVSFWDSIVKQTIPIFKPPLLKGTIQTFLLMAICCSTNNVFFMWYPTMVNSFYSNSSTNFGEAQTFCEKIVSDIRTSSSDENALCKDDISDMTIYSGIAFSIAFSAINLGVSRLAMYRRIVLIITLVISGASSIVVDLVYQPIVSMVLFILVQLTGICIGNVASYFVDVYPTSYRGLGTSLGMMFARMTSLIGVNIVGATIVDNCRFTFFAWAIFIFIGVAVSLVLPKDKKFLPPQERKVYISSIQQSLDQISRHR